MFKIADLPDDKVLAGKVLDTQAAQTSRQMEIGIMGRIFGSATEKPGNIAGCVLLLSFTLLGCLLIWGNDSQSLTKKDAVILVGGFITLTLGYVFGHFTGKHE